MIHKVIAIFMGWDKDFDQRFFFFLFSKLKNKSNQKWKKKVKIKRFVDFLSVMAHFKYKLK